jgi:hypothetical protein
MLQRLIRTRDVPSSSSLAVTQPRPPAEAYNVVQGEATERKSEEQSVNQYSASLSMLTLSSNSLF